MLSYESDGFSQLRPIALPIRGHAVKAECRILLCLKRRPSKYTGGGPCPGDLSRRSLKGEEGSSQSEDGSGRGGS